MTGRKKAVGEATRERLESLPRRTYDLALLLNRAACPEKAGRFDPAPVYVTQAEMLMRMMREGRAGTLVRFAAEINRDILHV